MLVRKLTALLVRNAVELKLLFSSVVASDFSALFVLLEGEDFKTFEGLSRSPPSQLSYTVEERHCAQHKSVHKARQRKLLHASPCKGAHSWSVLIF